MAGLSIIILAIFISLFCYVLIPDSSPDANEMNLALGTLRPGTRVTLIQTSLRTEPEQPSLLMRWLNGSPSRYKSMAVDSVVLKGDTILYREFGAGEGPEYYTESRHIAEFVSGTKEFVTARGKISWITSSGDRIEKSTGEVRQEFLKSHLVKRSFLLGTDRFGRDLLSRIMAGTRVSMSVGLIAVIISLVVGIFLGSLAGFFRGRTDALIMWLIQVIWSVPTLLLVIAITMALGKGIAQVFIAVGLTMWVEVARVVRGQIFSLREMEFVEAGRALGYTGSRIILRHILPNIMSPVIVIAASNFASAILLEAGLSFLGMGAQPPTPSWGMMIKEHYGYIIVDAAYLAIYPGLAIMVMVLAFTWLGNGLRDAMDAKGDAGTII